MFKKLRGRAVPPRQPTADQVRKAQDQRMANLAMEFGFTQEQARRWFDLTLTRAKANRAASAKDVLDEWKPTGPSTSG